MTKIPIYSTKEQPNRRRAGAIAFTAAFLSLGLAAVVTAAPAAAQDSSDFGGTMNWRQYRGSYDAELFFKFLSWQQTLAPATI